jgi:hypothetical protein
MNPTARKHSGLVYSSIPVHYKEMTPDSIYCEESFYRFCTHCPIPLLEKYSTIVCNCQFQSTRKEKIPDSQKYVYL